MECPTENHQEFSSERDEWSGNRHHIAVSARRRGDSDAKYAEGRRVRSGRAAIRTPYGCRIGRQEFAFCIHDCEPGPVYRHLRNDLSRKVETVSRDANRQAGLRQQHQTLGPNSWEIRRRVMVGHSRHGIRRLNAVALTFRPEVASTHECADPGRNNNPNQQSQEKYRSCSSSDHAGELYLKLCGCANQNTDFLQALDILRAVSRHTSFTGTGSWLVRAITGGCDLRHRQRGQRPVVCLLRT